MEVNLEKRSYRDSVTDDEMSESEKDSGRPCLPPSYSQTHLDMNMTSPDTGLGQVSYSGDGGGRVGIERRLPSGKPARGALASLKAILANVGKRHNCCLHLFWAGLFIVFFIVGFTMYSKRNEPSSENRNFTTEVQIIRERLAGADALHNQLRKEMHDRLEAIHGRIGVLNSSQTILATTVSGNRKDIQALSINVTSVEHGLQALSSKVMDLTSVVDHLSSNVSEAWNMLLTHNDSLDLSHLRINITRKDLEALTNDVGELRALSNHVTKLVDDVTQLRQLSNDVTQLKTMLSGDVNKMKLQMKSLEAAKTSAEQANVMLANQLSRIESSLYDLQTRPANNATSRKLGSPSLVMLCAALWMILKVMITDEQ